MKHRSPLTPLLLSIITGGIYSIVWYVKTKNEMNSLGARIPTAWLVTGPIGGIFVQSAFNNAMASDRQLQTV